MRRQRGRSRRLLVTADRFAALEAGLVAAGTLEPLSAASDADAQTWSDCDLISLVENRFFEPLDPRSLDEQARTAWRERAVAPNERFTDPRMQIWYRRPYWLLAENQRAGTVALHPAVIGDGFLGISSLYVFPSHRRRGIAARALGAVDEAARKHALEGLRITTHWAWQAAVRFYLFQLRCWVLHWKASLVFALKGALPPHTILIDGTEATFDAGGGRLIDARAERDKLRWVETLAMKRLDRTEPERALEARQTFAVALALSGFPLIRSGKDWRARRIHIDGGTPEGLAHKIRIFEGWDRRCGFELRTPRIPGLRYGR
jgi:GNAT superfamily N-acetyltransferase